MKIAVLAPIQWRTPPRKYGPWELVASLITEGMVKRGHQVTLYATGDSQTTARLKWVCPRPIHEDETLEPRVYQYLHTAQPFEDAAEYDIIHNHFDAYPLVFSKLVQTPVVTTLHGFSSPQVSEIYRRYTNTSFVSISLADRLNAPDLPYAANIYHGIPVEDFQFNDQPQDYFCFVGRISPDKGVHLAIALAKKLGFKLKIAGLVPEENKMYFETEIQPNLTQDIEYLGLISETDKKDLIRNAKAFLHFNTYPEGFGLTLVEAMASGTPVIGMRLGSIPEVVEDQQTGFVLNSMEEAAAAIQKIDQISRQACRSRVEKYFSLARMLSDYEALYQKIISNSAHV